MFKITQQQLRINYWFVTHKAQLKKALTISLIFLNCGIWGYGIYGWSLYFATSKDHQEMLKSLSQELIDWPVYHQKNKPQDLVVSEITVIPLDKNRYDLVAQVENPNLKWAIFKVDYRWVAPQPLRVAPQPLLGGSRVGHQEEASWSTPGFFLPGEKKFLLGLNISSSEPIRNPQIEFQNIQWKRITPRTKLAEVDKSNFLIKDIHFCRSRGCFPTDYVGTITSGLATTKSTMTEGGRVQFEVTNKTNYNFWEVNFKIILYQGQKIVGANFVSVPQFLSGESRLHETFWTSSLPTVTKVYIEPEVNILDSEMFIPLKGGIGEEK